MLTRIYGKFVFECEMCTETLETNTHDFAEAKRCMDEAGWRAEKIGKNWEHRCPEHYNEV